MQKGYCKDLSATPKYHDLCYSKYPYTYAADAINTAIATEYDNEGIIDLCHSKCFLKDDADP